VRKNAGKERFSDFAMGFRTVAMPHVVLAIGAELPTSRGVVFGTVIGDRWVDMANLPTTYCTGTRFKKPDR
jgi:hypothetical protein